MKNLQFDEVIVESGSESSPIYRNLRQTLRTCRFTLVDDIAPDKTVISVETASARRKENFILRRHKGEFLKKCPGSEGQVCCNYFVINFASNCPMDCSYCYLQEYLADNSALKVFSNVDDLIAETDRTLARHRGVFFRIGTGEITDSLALEPYTGMVREIDSVFCRAAERSARAQNQKRLCRDVAGPRSQGPGRGRLVDESAAGHRSRRARHGIAWRKTERGTALPRCGLPAWAFTSIR